LIWGLMKSSSQTQAFLAILLIL